MDRFKIDNTIEWWDSDGTRLHKKDGLGRKLCTASGWVYDNHTIKPPCQKCTEIVRRKTHTREWNALWIPKYGFSYAEVVTLHIVTAVRESRIFTDLSLCGLKISRSTLYPWTQTKKCKNCKKRLNSMSDKAYEQLPKRRQR